MDMIAAGSYGFTGMLMDFFGYNRKNFMNDRRQRQVMEYQLVESKIIQSDLWRDDVREAIELTPKKMEVYLLVIALELTGAATCLCKARVPPGAPAWLVSASVLSICTAITYLLLGLWFGLHAFVASQAYKVRILTQLVRLPIPTWSAMEAARTYASDFEGMNKKQMLRVPFAGGSQESWVSSSGEASAEGANPIGRPGSGAPQEGELAADPWGLERSGQESILELDPAVNASKIEKQRHVWLIREAAKFFNTYDAFCRVCMSAGTSSLATFFCFWCLSYVCTEIGAPVAAWGGMFIFSSITLLLLRTDQMLSVRQYMIGSLLLFTSPCLCAAVTFVSSKHWGNPGRWELLIPIGFFLKGCWWLYYLHLFNVREYQTGAVLPSSFKAVLYVDAYGWAKHSSVWWQRLAGRVGWANGNRRAATRSAAQLAAEEPVSRFGTSSGASRLPASRCAEGRPMRPEDLRSASDHEGRFVQSSAECGDDEELSDRPVSFRPGTFANLQGDTTTGSEQATSGSDIAGERPGAVPWRAFWWTTVLVAAMWWSSSAVCLYDAITGRETFKRAHYGLKPGQVAPLPVLIGSRVKTGWDASAISEPHGFTCDMNGVIFATAGRDTGGRKTVLQGRLVDPDSQMGDFGIRFTPAPPCDGLDAESMIQDLALHNCEGDGDGCNAIVLPLRGKQLLSCPLSSRSLLSSLSLRKEDKLNRNASVLAGHPIGRSWLEDRGGSPLDDTPGMGHLLHPEELTSLSAAPCPMSADGIREVKHNCLVVGTTARRIVHLGGASNARAKDGFGRDVPWLPRGLLQKEGLEVPGPGSFALLDGGHFLGVLHRDASTVHLLDLHSGGRPAGTWRLPSPMKTDKRESEGEHWAGICAGGGALYALQAGSSPSIWRFPHPTLPVDF
mmetsp:Transcript_15230/g.27105  ORF Transcript_15230/g.27105 Transcript_15230/m.27105 type:complete len:899 (-) Transcript_15230:15-2711(-)